MLNNNDGLVLPRKTQLNTTDSVQAVALLREVCQQALSVRAASVICTAEHGSVHVSYLDGEGKEVASQGYAEIPFHDLQCCVLNRKFCWPEVGDPLWANTSKQVRRILSCKAGEPSLLADVHVRRNKSITFDSIHWEQPISIEELLDFDEAQADIFWKTVKPKSGIVVANSGPATEVVGLAAVLACRPDALVVSDLSEVKFLKQTLDWAANHLVVVVADAQDPVEMLSNVIGQFASIGKLEQAAGMARGAVAHRRLKRVCSSCAKSTSIDRATLGELPDSVRPHNAQTTMVGLGCDICQQSGFRGSLGVSSLVAGTKRVQGLLEDSATIEQITELSYRNGSRSLVEDAVGMVVHGMTTMATINETLKRMSPAFEACAIQQTSVGDDSLLDRQINNELSSIDEDFFIDEDAEPGKRRLLIVEDDCDQQEVLKLVVEKAGFIASIACDGVEALEELKTSDFDLVICDLMMPRMNGKEFVTQVRSDPDLKNMPVMMLTAIDSPDAEHLLLDTGADDYCAKTMRRDVLIKRVERLLNRAGG